MRGEVHTGHARSAIARAYSADTAGWLCWGVYPEERESARFEEVPPQSLFSQCYHHGSIESFNALGQNQPASINDFLEKGRQPRLLFQSESMRSRF